MSVTDLGQKTIANLGWTDIKLTHPNVCWRHPNAESEVLDKRESKSRASVGLVTLKTIGWNQDKLTVCEFSCTMLIMKRGSNDFEIKVNY